MSFWVAAQTTIKWLSRFSKIILQWVIVCQVHQGCKCNNQCILPNNVCQCLIKCMLVLYLVDHHKWKWLQYHVFALHLFWLLHWHRALWNLVKQIELLDFRRHVGDDYLALVRSLWKKIVERVFLIFMFLVISMNYHYVIFQSYFTFLYFSSVQDKIATSLDSDADSFISFKIMISIKSILN